MAAERAEPAEPADPTGLTGPGHATHDVTGLDAEPDVCVRVLSRPAILTSAGEAELRRSADRRLLVVLALAAPATVPRAEVVAQVWPVGSRPIDAERELRSAVARVRSHAAALGWAGPVIEMSRTALRLVVPSDVARFRTLVAAAQAARAAGAARRALDLWREALSVWGDRGEVDLAASGEGTWSNGALVAATEIERERADALEGLVLAVAGSGEAVPAWVLQALSAAAQVNPADERLAALLAASHADAGRSADARAVVQAHAEALAASGLDVRASLRTVEALASDPDSRRARGGLLGLLRLAFAWAPGSDERSEALVGRGRDLAWLRDRFDDSTVEPVLAIVAGPRGSGRSALLRSFADDRRRAGARVVTMWCTGRSDGGGSRDDPLAMFADRLGAWPDLGDTSTWRSLSDVARAIERRAHVAPVVIVVDDADEGPDELMTSLSALVSSMLTGGVLVVASIASADIDDVALVDDIDRSGTGLRRIDPLPDAAMARLIRRWLPMLPADAARSLHALAAGRPGRVVAVAADGAHLAEGAVAEGAEARVAWALDATEAVRDEITTMAGAAVAAVDVLALSGGVLDAGVLEQAVARCGSASGPAVVSALRERGILQPGVVAGEVRLASLLIEAVLATVPSWRAARAHVVLADALTATPGSTERVAAHRWAAAQHGVGRVAAIEAAQLAGRRAAMDLDHAGAGRWLTAARVLAEGAAPDEGVTAEVLCEALIAEGEALGWAGDPDAGGVLQRAAVLARTLDSPVLLARSLTVIGGDLGGSRRWDTSPIEELRPLLARLAPDDHRNRALVLSTLAWLLSARLDAEGATQAARQALDAAEAAGDAAVRARAWTAYLESAPHDEDVPGRLTLSGRLVGVGRLLDDRRLVAVGMAHRATALFAGADGAALPEIVQIVRRLHRDFDIPFAQPARSLLALLRGDLVSAEAIAGAQLRAAGPDADDDQYTALLLQVANVMRWQGRLGQFFDSGFTPPTGLLEGPGQVAMTVALAELGQPEQAGELLAAVVAGLDSALRAYPAARLVVVGLAAEACVLTERVDLAPPLIALLEPAADLGLNCTAWVHAWLGAASHHLGSLLTLVGRYDEARPWLAAAEDRHRSLGAWPYLVATHLARARLEQRDPAGTPTAAADHLAAALALADTYGLSRSCALFRLSEPEQRTRTREGSSQGS